MVKEKTLREYLEEEDEITQWLQVETQKLKSTMNLKHRYNMKERTLRLCNIGRTVIRYMPLEEFSDETITGVLEALFKSPQIQDWLKKVKARSEVCEETR